MRWWWFAAWAVVGLLAAFGIAAILTVGVVFVVLAAAAAAVVAWHRPPSAALLGLALGAAAIVGYLGWLNRGGPGQVCHSAAGSTTCTDAWDPWPFVAVAAVLAVGSVLAFARARGDGPSDGADW